MEKKINIGCTIILTITLLSAIVFFLYTVLNDPWERSWQAGEIFVGVTPEPIKLGQIANPAYTPFYDGVADYWQTIKTQQELKKYPRLLEVEGCQEFNIKEPAQAIFAATRYGAVEAVEVTLAAPKVTRVCAPEGATIEIILWYAPEENQ